MHYLLNANVRVTTFVLGMKIKKKKKRTNSAERVTFRGLINER